MIILQGLLTSNASSRGRRHPALKGLQPIFGTSVVRARQRFEEEHACRIRSYD
jgi:hypothetical protein